MMINVSFVKKNFLYLTKYLFKKIYNHKIIKQSDYNELKDMIRKLAIFDD